MKTVDSVFCEMLLTSAPEVRSFNVLVALDHLVFF